MHAAPQRPLSAASLSEKDSTASAKHLQLAGSVTVREDIHACARTRHLAAASFDPHLSTISWRSAALNPGVEIAAFPIELITPCRLASEEPVEASPEASEFCDALILLALAAVAASGKR